MASALLPCRRMAPALVPRCRRRGTAGAVHQRTGPALGGLDADGYYAASPGGEDLIGWQVNGPDWDAPVSFFPASRFRDTFYRPDVVTRVLAAGDAAKALEEANAETHRQDSGTIDNSASARR